jgi:hypothetical protein
MGGKLSPRVATILVGVSALMAASEAQAARQGSLGAVSTGTIGITVSIAPRARISAPHDVVFDASGRTVGSLLQRLCLSSNSATGALAVSATGSGEAGALELSNGEHTISYTVSWLTPGAAGTNLNVAASRAGCDGGKGAAALVVALDPAHLEEARGGAPYTGTLTLIISPE